MKNFIAVGNTLTITADADIASGAGVLIGAIFGVATGPIANGAEGVVFKFLGATYKAGRPNKLGDALKLKFGLAYERTPVQSPASQTARIPDADRLWLTLGGQWNAGRYGKFDLGYAYIHLKDAGISQVKGASTLNGEYDAAGHLLGMQYSVGF